MQNNGMQQPPGRSPSPDIHRRISDGPTPIQRTYSMDSTRSGSQQGNGQRERVNSYSSDVSTGSHHPYPPPPPGPPPPGYDQNTFRPQGPPMMPQPPFPTWRPMQPPPNGYMQPYQQQPPPFMGPPPSHMTMRPPDQPPRPYFNNLPPPGYNTPPGPGYNPRPPYGYVQPPYPQYGHLERQSTVSSNLERQSTVSSIMTSLPATRQMGSERSDTDSEREKAEGGWSLSPQLQEILTRNGGSLEGFRQKAKESIDPQLHLEYGKFLIAAGDALFILAECHGTGALGVAVDHDKAFNLYLQAVKQNHPAATYRVAHFSFFRKGASLGETSSMYKLGMILLNGLLGQNQNIREAVNWLKKAAQQADKNNPHSLHELGLLYEEKNASDPAAADPSYSRELFHKAAQFGYAPSQYRLGLCYEYGLLGLPVDPRRSIAWYTKAAEQGEPEAELALSGWYLTGADGILRQNDTEAYLWARKAADKGLGKAEYAVGHYTETGVGVRVDYDEARKWYLRAAAQGNKRAIHRLKELKGVLNPGTDRSRGGDWRNEKDAKNGDCVVM
ncbi:hypothetical protein BC829DRAFT_425192 [Chytridium lagenaria]|nr:hypothetical protein BC829DRAFT_425192 [Chytridium lagenaria]